MKRVIILFLLVCNVACTETNSSFEYNPSKKAGAKVELDGEKLFSRNCTSCHGEDGKQGYSGAKDLSISTLSDEQINDIILNGKGGMMPYKTIFKTQEQLDSVRVFVKTLRK